MNTDLKFKINEIVEQHGVSVEREIIKTIDAARKISDINLQSFLNTVKTSISEVYNKYQAIVSDTASVSCVFVTNDFFGSFVYVNSISTILDWLI